MRHRVPQGGRRSPSLLIAAMLVLGIALLAAAAGGTAQTGPATDGSGAKKCTKAFVGGERVCLRIGDRCKKRFQDDYVFAGLSCVKGRVRRAGIAELRGEQPVLLDKQGQVPLKTALAAFDASVVDLPGVKAKKGEIGELTDASFVIGAIEESIDQLSPEQRAVVEAATTPAPGAATLPPEGKARIEPRSAARSATAPRGGTGGITIGAGTLQEQTFALRSLQKARDVMRGHGFTLLRPITVSFLDTTKIIRGDPALAYVPYSDLPPAARSSTCNIFVTKEGRAESQASMLLVYAHELAHCAQHAFFSSKAEAKKAPEWVIEGGADWLGGMTVKELGSEPVGVEWEPWLEEPETDLYERVYDGVGFFAMIHQTGQDGWQRMRDTLFASSGGAGPAFNLAIAGLPDIFHDRWGPGLVRNKDLGAEWNYEGPGIPSSGVEDLNVSSSNPQVLQAAARASAAGELRIFSDILIIKADKAIRGKLNTQGATRKLAKGAYCVKQGGCKCKTQTNLQLPKVGFKAFVGFNDPFKARTVTFEGRSLKEYCKKPSPGPGPGSCTARRGGDGDSCPVPAPGIEIYNDPKFTAPVARFRIGDCTVGPGGFTAIATDGAWRLEVGIQNFSGFGRGYEILYGGSDPQVIIDGPGGPYSNTTWVPPGQSSAGSIEFDADGRHMGLGFIEFRDASASASIAGAGGMTCVYPDD